MDVPAGRPWRSQVSVDPCSDDHHRIILLENDATRDRLKIDLVGKTVTAVFTGPPQRLDWLIHRIQRSFAGERAIPPELRATLPLPTLGPCDPAVAVPTLYPEPTPWPTVPSPPTWTPEPTPPAEGREEISTPQPGETPPSGP